MNQTSDRAKAIKPSITISIAEKARKLKAEGKNIISLSIGEPDFTTPPHICDAAIAAIKAGDTHYPPVDGTVPLKEAIMSKMKRDNQLNYQNDEIQVCCGGKQSIYNALQATLNDGDEVIIPAPYWVSYPDMVVLSGGKPVIIKAGIEQDFKITPEQLEDAITDKTRLFLINSPSNPSGAAYTRDELIALSKVLLKHPKVMILSDEIYEHVLWSEEPFCNIVMACPELKDRTMIINGASKAYAMTGWRVGFIAGPADLVKVAKKIQSQSTSGICTIAQAAATEAFNGSLECVKEMTAEFKKRHDFMVAALNKIPGFKVRENEGTFYNFIDANEAINNSSLTDDVALADYLLDEAEVAVVPGTGFGMPGYIRLSFATDMGTLKKAVDRIQQAIEKLS